MQIIRVTKNVPHPNAAKPAAALMVDPRKERIAAEGHQSSNSLYGDTFEGKLLADVLLKGKNIASWDDNQSEPLRS